MANKPDKPRCVSVWEFACYASKEAFIRWEEVPDEWKQEFNDNGSVPCDGGGNTGPWCGDCRFGTEEWVGEEGDGCL